MKTRENIECQLQLHVGYSTQEKQTKKPKKNTL